MPIDLGTSIITSTAIVTGVGAIISLMRGKVPGLSFLLRNGSTNEHSTTTSSTTSPTTPNGYITRHQFDKIMESVVSDRLCTSRQEVLLAKMKNVEDKVDIALHKIDRLLEQTP